MLVGDPDRTIESPRASRLAPFRHTVNMRKSSDDPAQGNEARRLLARAPMIQNACDLDLMIFLHRHPRILLTSERLAELVGYDRKEIAKALDGFIEAGLVERTAQQSMHAARMFVLLLDSPQGGGMRALLELGSTRVGRQHILEVLDAAGPGRKQSDASPELRLLRRA